MEFRPLRTDREEDWSDWLAYLLKTSTRGVLAHAVFGPADAEVIELAAPPKVKREFRVEDRRADVVVKVRSSDLRVCYGPWPGTISAFRLARGDERT